MLFLFFKSNIQFRLDVASSKNLMSVRGKVLPPSSRCLGIDDHLFVRLLIYSPTCQ